MRGMTLKDRIKRAAAKLARRQARLDKKQRKARAQKEHIEALRLKHHRTLEQAANLKAQVHATKKHIDVLEKWLKEYEAQHPTDLHSRALAEARRALARHIHETGGNNRGPAVEEIIHYANGDTGEPWCVDFVIWCFGHAGSNVIHPGFTRAVAYMAGPATISTQSPVPGAPVRYVFDHTGVFVAFCDSHGNVVPREVASCILAIEGNTGTIGAVSDGMGTDGVYLKVRPRSLVRDFLRVTG